MSESIFMTLDHRRSESSPVGAGEKIKVPGARLSASSILQRTATLRRMVMEMRTESFLATTEAAILEAALPEAGLIRIVESLAEYVVKNPAVSPQRDGLRTAILHLSEVLAPPADEAEVYLMRTKNAYRILHTIQGRPQGIGHGALADELNMRPNNLTAQVRPLVVSGLVERQQNSKFVTYHLSDRGSELSRLTPVRRNRTET